jgi:hypothetical protein
MNRDTIRQALVLISAFATVIFNILASALPLNGLNTGEISDRFQIFFVPAGYVFSIWFLIFIGLLAYGIYQALPAQRENSRLQSIGYLFILSCIANVSWLFLWHYEVFQFTLIAMLTLLLSLIAIYLRLDIGRSEIANTTQLLYYQNWDGFGISPEIWAAIMLAVGVLLSAVVSFTRADIAYSLVLVWAYLGIAVKHAGTPLVTAGAIIGAGLILILLVVAVIRKNRGQTQEVSSLAPVGNTS